MIDQHDENNPSKPSSHTDLLEIPSDNLPGQKPTPVTTLQLVDNMAENFGVLTRMSFLLLGTCHSPPWTVRGNQEKVKKRPMGRKPNTLVRMSREKFSAGGLGTQSQY
jgi:hypothetical protein